MCVSLMYGERVHARRCAEDEHATIRRNLRRKALDTVSG